MERGLVCFHLECALCSIASQRKLGPTCRQLHYWDMDWNVQALGARWAPLQVQWIQSSANDINVMSYRKPKEKKNSIYFNIYSIIINRFFQFIVYNSLAHQAHMTGGRQFSPHSGITSKPVRVVFVTLVRTAHPNGAHKCLVGLKSRQVHVQSVKVCHSGRWSSVPDCSIAIDAINPSIIAQKPKTNLEIYNRALVLCT